jgi:hypothetical protein
VIHTLHYDNQLFVFHNGRLLYKRWYDQSGTGRKRRSIIVDKFGPPLELPQMYPTFAQIKAANPTFFDAESKAFFGDRGHTLEGYFLTMHCSRETSDRRIEYYDSVYHVHPKTLDLMHASYDKVKWQRYIFVECPDGHVRRQYLTEMGEFDGEPVDDR